MLAILNYGVGNIANVQNAFARLGMDTYLTSSSEEILLAKSLVLPGVGAFQNAMDALKQQDLIVPLCQRLSQNRPTLGICLGMQLLCESSLEHGNTKGLGFFKGSLHKFPLSVKVPHMGWNRLEKRNEHPIAANFPPDAYAYFVHSYFLKGYADKDLIHTAFYGSCFPATIARGNVIGVQFHPEKSGVQGQIFLKNFIALSSDKKTNWGNC